MRLRCGSIRSEPYTLAVPMIALGVPEEYFQSIPSRSYSRQRNKQHDFKYSPNIDPPYPAYGGMFRDEAIMLLRRFYVQENDKGKEYLNLATYRGTELDLAPDPRTKGYRELKTRIAPLVQHEQI